MGAFNITRRGFSLVELMVTVAIFAVVIGVIYRVLIQSTKTVSSGKMAASVEQNLRVGMDEMLKDIRQAGYGLGSHPAFTRAGKREIRMWADIDGVKPTNLVRYFIGDPSDMANTPNPNDRILYKLDSAIPGPIPIATGVTSIEFQYYDKDGVALLNGTGDDAIVEPDPDVEDMNNNDQSDVSDIRGIEMTLVFETDRPEEKITYNDGYRQFSLSTKVYPQNLSILSVAGKPDALVSLVIEPDPAQTLLPGDEYQFSAIADYENSGTRDVTDLTIWVSSDTSVASVGSYIAGSSVYNDEGLVTGKSEGVTTISAAYEGTPADNQVNVKVGGPEVTDVRINGSPTFTMLEGSQNSVLLTAQVTDLGFGGNTVIGARWDVPSQGVGGIMSPADGSFNSPVENVFVNVDITGWTTGGSPYDFYVQGKTADAPLSWGPREGAILGITNVDDLGPMVENLKPWPSDSIPEGAPSITITANLNDQAMGASNISNGEAFVGQMNAPGTGLSMSPIDGTLDSPLEGMTVTLNSSMWTRENSPYRIFVLGKDVAGNWGSEAYVDVTVTAADNQGPLVTSTTAPTSISGGTADITINGTASDVTTGGSSIIAVEAFADTDPGLGNGTPMGPVDGSFDSPSEVFGGKFDTFSWQIGSSHVVYVRAQDVGGMWGPVNSFNVSVTSGLNGKDAVVALSNGDFEVWHGDGVGGFKGSDTYSTGVIVTDLIIADVNADSESDVIVSSDTGEIQVWLNDGFGSLGLTPAQVITALAPINTIVAADFNGDEQLDLVAGASDGYLYYYQNDGTGALYTSNYLTLLFTSFKFIYKADVADYNGDSYPDVLVAGVDSFFSGLMKVLLHPGDPGGDWGGFGSYLYSGFLAGVAVGDYNMDGHKDVVLGVNYPSVGSGVELWKGSGSGNLQWHASQSLNDEVLTIRSDDYNNDGSPDILVGTAGTSGQEVHIFANDGAGSFDMANPFDAVVGVPMSSIGIDFMDQDSDPDVVTAGMASGSLYTFIQQPTNELLQSINSPFASADAAVVLRIGEIGD